MPIKTTKSHKYIGKYIIPIGVKLQKKYLDCEHASTPRVYNTHQMKGLARSSVDPIKIFTFCEFIPTIIARDYLSNGLIFPSLIKLLK